MNTPATRLITLIMLLQQKSNQKAADLAGDLGISVRTLHRYINMLDEMGIPICSERGPHGGFSLVRGYKMPPLVFTPEEAVAVFLGTSLVGEMWGSLYREAAQGGMAKLNNVLPDDQRAEVAWAQRSLVATGMHRSDPEKLSPVLEKIRQATRKNQTILITYRDSTNKSQSERQVDPYAFVHRTGWWYLVGFCHLRQALRTFRIDRIQKIETLPQYFTIPGDFDINKYLSQTFADQPVVQAALKFIPKAAYLVTSNLPGLVSHKENPDGSVDVILTAPDITWLASIVMSFANLVIVLDPPELRTLVREWARELVEKYKKD